MAEADWIEDAVNEFRKGCRELEADLSQAANGTFLDVSDEKIMRTLEPLLKEVQQKAIQKALAKAQDGSDYRRCNKCKKK